MKIGILSDSHKRVGRTKKLIDLLANEGAMQFVHAGDIVSPEVLEHLEATQLPYVAVFGNNDAHLFSLVHRYNLVQEPYRFHIGDVSATLMHHPTYLSYETELMIYGHTHIFDARMQNNTLIVNPGESCARDKPLSEGMLLEVAPSHFEVTYFYRTIKTQAWSRNTEIFTRKSQ